MTDFDKSGAEMAAAGFSLDKIPDLSHREHLWADGLLLFWGSHHRLPTAEQLQEEMFDEWDDPVGIEEAKEIIRLLKG